MEFNGVASSQTAFPRTAMLGRKFHARNGGQGKAYRRTMFFLSVLHASGRKKTTRCS